MYLTFLKQKKKFFYILKKFYHNNNYKNFLFFSLIKKIYFKKIFFKNIKCIKKNNNKKNIFSYFFLKEKKIYFFYNIFYIQFIIYYNCLINFFLFKSFLFLKLKNNFISSFYCFFSKFILNNYNCKKKNFYLTKFNNIIVFLNVNKKNTINKNEIFLFKKNFCLCFFKKKIFNIFLKIKNVIFVYNNKNFVIEFFFIISKLIFLLIFNNLKIKKNTKDNFVYQNAEFTMFKKSFIIINLNINLYTKKIFCKHKISFFFKKNIFYLYLNKKVLKKII
ncbi:hypothetical protein [Candidatus Carsonella ruddii]|uniref:hypothetical protein n=1 Tax=Carsonella ruddii TaxID=114186 RepID=UPI003D529F6D